MDFDMMARLFPAVREIAALDGTGLDAMAELLQKRRHALYRLVAVCAGRDAREVPQMEVADVLQSLAYAARDGLLMLICVCRAAGEEVFCTALYQYRPANPEALATLVKRRIRDDKATHYMANALRLLVLSKLEKGSSYPTLREVLEPHKAEPVKTGMEIMNDIMNAVLGGKENKKNDH